MYQLPVALLPLAQYRQFILVQLLPALDATGNPVPGKTVKHPIHPLSFKRHSAHDPAIWMDFATASSLAAITPPVPGTIGWCVGFVITERDPIVCLDIDSCATLMGTWNEDAQEMMRRFPGAVEVSLSGRGLHIWGMYSGVIPPHGKRNSARNMELYSELRFMALGSEASGQMYDLTTLLPGVIADFFPEIASGEDAGWTSEPVPEHTPLSDDELMHKAMSRTRRSSAGSIFGEEEDKKKYATFAELWARDVEALAKVYPPQMPGKEIDGSGADAALAKELAYWTGKNCERIEELMRRSALVRDKWDTRRKHTTYLRETIMAGVALCKAVYHEKQQEPLHLEGDVGNPLAPRVIDRDDTFIGRAELAVLFAGCVYIQDQNAVLLPNGDIVDQPRFNAKFAGRIFCMDNDNKKVSASAWEAFLGNQIVYFPRTEGTEFNPRLPYQAVVERSGRSWVNIYSAPKVDMCEGDTGPFLALLHKLLPNGDDAIILLSYMAAVVQNPGVKFRWAPFIQGTQGNGKSTIVECLRYALGHKYIFSVKAGMIENGFNAWLENNLLYVADDIYSTKDRSDMMEALKSLITERDHAITLKGIDSILKRICGNFIFTDNHKDAMKKQDDSRRICTLYCAQQSKYDRQRDGLTKYFFAREFIPYLEGGGYRYVAHMLATMPIDPRYNPAGECQEAPETSVTREAIIDGRTGLEHDVAEWIVLDEPGFSGGFVSAHMLGKKLENTKWRGSPLKVKEMMLRLGYEPHRYLPDGRLPAYVRPDDTRPILFVECNSWQGEITDAAVIGELYVAAQAAAQAARTERMMNSQGGM